MIHTAAAGIVGFGSARSRTIRFDCADNGGALISVHNCLPALNGAGSIFNWMPAKCQLHRRGSQIEPASLNNRRRPDTMAGAPGPIGPVPLSHATLVPPCSPSIDKARPCVVFKKSNKKVPYESCEIPCESRKGSLIPWETIICTWFADSSSMFEHATTPELEQARETLNLGVLHLY